MKIQLDDIPEDGLALEIEQNSEVFNHLQSELRDEGTFTGFHADVLLEPSETVLTVSGQFHSRLDTVCARCVDPVHLTLDEPFRFHLYRPSFQPTGNDAADEIELEDEALNYGFMEDEAVNVDDLLIEQVLLSIPSQILCQDSCRGLCQRCGAELNREPCRCDAPVVDPRFAVLKNLKVSA